ncbi:pilus assembly protein Flp/PilA [Evansella vedderi]|uniref:Pilus assembly protein Flp/PilA n=1 Tax=Evansella vedderi TaxID=38282 RepID=A0ABT9ZWZ0_9BACI|nr:Flp family type IVb pilin [Evansella vedderi]MDQ0255751.1 pilus assembly protein Flp/PilA [Evansella vedderi]
MKNLFTKLVRGEEGQGMTEYGLILGLIAVVAVGALALLGDEVKAIFDNITGSFTNPKGN